MKSLLCRFKGFAHKVAWKQRLHNSELSCFTNNGIKVGLNVFIAFFFFVRLCKKKNTEFKNVCAGLIYRLFKKKSFPCMFASLKTGRARHRLECKTKDFCCQSFSNLNFTLHCCLAMHMKRISMPINLQTAPLKTTT